MPALNPAIHTQSRIARWERGAVMRATVDGVLEEGYAVGMTAESRFCLPISMPKLLPGSRT